MRTRFAFALVSTFAAIVLLLACAGTPTTPSESFEFALSPSTVAAGATSVGTITVRGGTHQLVRIDLWSSDAVASVPPSILVPPGVSATFSVRTRVVAADTIARITAAVGDVKQEIALQVLAEVARPPTLDMLKLEAASVRGGQDLQGTVGLTAVAPPGGLSVTIKSSNAAAVVPAPVLIQPGELNAGFIVSTRPVVLDTHLEITASYSDQIRTVPLRVTP